MEPKQRKLDAWDAPTQGPPQPQETRIVWPVHWRVKTVSEAISDKLPSLVEHETRSGAPSYERIPPSALPDIGQKDFYLQSDVLPGWTGKAPTSTDPLGADSATVPKENPTPTIAIKGLRDTAQDWRTHLSHASVLAHALDAMDTLKDSVPEASVPVFQRQLKVARIALSKIIVGSAKNVANHNIWERHQAMQTHMRSDLVLCSTSERAEMRTLPMDSNEHLFGNSRASVSATITKKKEAGSKTITVKVNPEQVLRQAARQPSASKGSAPGAKSKTAKKPAKKEPEKAPKKPQEPKASSSFSKATDSTKTSEGAAAKKKNSWKGKKQPPPKK